MDCNFETFANSPALKVVNRLPFNALMGDKEEAKATDLSEWLVLTHSVVSLV